MVSVLQNASTEIDENVGFRCRTIYHTEDFKLHYHDYYEIFLTLTKGVYHDVNGITQTLPQGSLVFIRKDDVHYYRADNIGEPSFINLAFTEEIMHQLFEYLSDGFCFKELLSSEMPPCVQLHEADVKWMLHQMDRLNYTRLNDTPKLKYRLRVLLFKIFTRFFAEFGEDTRLDNSSNMPVWLIELDREMQKHKNFSLNGDHMVQMSGKSRAYLGRMIKQYFGKTIPEYISDLRLNYWANCLINSDAPIVDICYECGFENVSWAYTLFKNKFGTSPMKFRKNAK